MKYLMFIKHSEKYRNQAIPQGLNEAMGEFVNEGFKSGILKDTAGLKATEHAYLIRLSGGKLMKIDGPFTESKEVIGGYALIEVKTEDEALKVARDFMEIHLKHWPTFEGECEVRPLDE